MVATGCIVAEMRNMIGAETNGVCVAVLQNIICKLITVLADL